MNINIALDNFIIEHSKAFGNNLYERKNPIKTKIINNRSLPSAMLVISGVFKDIRSLINPKFETKMIYIIKATSYFIQANKKKSAIPNKRRINYIFPVAIKIPRYIVKIKMPQFS